MLYRFKYLNDDAVKSDRPETLEFASDAEAIKATDDGVRCMISDRLRHRLPMQPSSAVQVADESGRVVCQVAVADVLKEALELEPKP